MELLGDGLARAWDLIRAGDPWLLQLVGVTLQVALVPTAVAVGLGVPLGLLAGLGRSRASAVARVMANAGLGVPPVLVGLVLALLLTPDAPLGGLDLLLTLRGVLVAQLLLSLPIVVALTASAVRDVPPALLDQARAFGAGRFGVAVLAGREARVGVVAAVIASVGSGLSQVGAVVLVGGNVEGVDQTLASAALTSVGEARYAEAMAIAVILTGLTLVVVALLTWLQHGGHHGERHARTPWAVS